MQPAIRRQWPIPSTCLLRFLRSQTDVALSTCRETKCLAESAARPKRSRQFSSNSVSSSQARRANTTSTDGLYAPAAMAMCSIRFAATVRPTTRLIRNNNISSFNCSSATAATRAFFSSSPNKRKGWIQKDPKQPAAATAAAQTWQERLWGLAARRGRKPLKPDDLPGHEELDQGSYMFNSRRVMSAKAALEPRLRCTEVDENGEVILVDGEFKKTELIAKVRLRYLDEFLGVKCYTDLTIFWFL